MIARVDLKNGRGFAVLGDDGRWKADDQVLTQSLNLTFGEDAYPATPSAAPVDVADRVKALAAAFGSEIEWFVVADPDVQGRVY